MRPYVGASVLFVLTETVKAAAVIVAVWDPETLNVSLAYWDVDGTPGVARHTHYGTGVGMWHELEVPA